MSSLRKILAFCFQLPDPAYIQYYPLLLKMKHSSSPTLFPQLNKVLIIKMTEELGYIPQSGVGRALDAWTQFASSFLAWQPMEWYHLYLEKACPIQLT